MVTMKRGRRSVTFRLLLSATRWMSSIVLHWTVVSLREVFKPLHHSGKRRKKDKHIFHSCKISFSDLAQDIYCLVFASFSSSFGGGSNISGFDFVNSDLCDAAERCFSAVFCHHLFLPPFIIPQRRRHTKNMENEFRFCFCPRSMAQICPECFSS